MGCVSPVKIRGKIYWIWRELSNGLGWLLLNEQWPMAILLCWQVSTSWNQFQKKYFSSSSRGLFAQLVSTKFKGLDAVGGGLLAANFHAFLLKGWRKPVPMHYYWKAIKKQFQCIAVTWLDKTSVHALLSKGWKKPVSMHNYWKATHNQFQCITDEWLEATSFNALLLKSCT